MIKIREKKDEDNREEREMEGTYGSEWALLLQ